MVGCSQLKERNVSQIFMIDSNECMRTSFTALHVFNQPRHGVKVYCFFFRLIESLQDVRRDFAEVNESKLLLQTDGKQWYWSGGRRG